MDFSSSRRNFWDCMGYIFKALRRIYTILGMIVSFYFLAKAVKALPIGIAYPLWTGIGAVGAVAVSVIIFKDRFTLVQGFFVILLLIGIVGLKVFSKH